MSIQKLTTTVTFAAAATVCNDSVLTGNGYVTDLKVTTPTYSNAVSACVYIKDAAGTALYSTAWLAQSTATFVHPTNALPFGSNFIIDAVLSSVSGSAASIAIDLYIEE